MLPLSIKDDEYKPPKFNLFGKISGWFRCGMQACWEGVSGTRRGRKSRFKAGPRAGRERQPPPPGRVWTKGGGTQPPGSRHPLESRVSPACVLPRSILSDKTSRNLFFFLCLNLSFAFVELLYGIWSNW
jgi:hypothetical protein